MIKVLSAVLLCLFTVSAQAAHSQARLLLAAESARPGDTVWAGLHLHMAPGWHTYWKNSGAAGIPTKIDWQLPPGVTAGPTQWPVPEKLPEQELTTYVYKDDVVLLTPLKLAPNLSPGPLEMKAKVSWLECNLQCVPGDADVQAGLKVGTETKPSRDAALLKSWESKLPQKSDSLSARAWWEKAPSGDSRALLLEWSSSKPAAEADFFPDASSQFEVQPATERIPAPSGKVALRKQVKKLSGDWPKELFGVLVQQSKPERLAYEVNLAIQRSGPALATTAPGMPTPSLWKMLLYAFLGGLILNVMPCVLPVIALKILGFVGQAKDEPRRVRTLGLIYALGVLVSFLALAALVIGVKAAGHKAGWGMQFGNPQFLVVLTILVTLVALNLFGVFEVSLTGRVMGAAGTLASRHGAAGAFFNGVLATALATPCTAPFLGYALGFAFTQSAGIILLILSTVGIGLAAPYVILSWQPAWLTFLPKPGPWMERFKAAMGFPMLATAIWLFSLIPLHYGERSWWLGLFLVLLAMAAWVYGQFVQRAREHRWLGWLAVLVLLATGYRYVIEGQLHWRSPIETSAASAPLAKDPNGLNWQPWSAAAVAEARAQGRPVLVDFTADWCLTCQANKKLAIDIPSVRVKLKQINAVSLLGDYTRLPDDITTELNRFGRAGVPLVLVYPKDTSKPPLVLPEALTPGVVLRALERAGR